MAFFERPRDTYDALRQSLGKIRGAKLIATGTRPPETDNPFHGLLDDPEADTLALKWTYTGPRAGALTMRAARSCNPSLGRFPELAPQGQGGSGPGQEAPRGSGGPGRSWRTVSTWRCTSAELRPC